MVDNKKKYKSRSSWLEAWIRIKRNKSAVAGMVIILLIIIVAILAPVLIDYKESVIKQDIVNRLQPPSKEHWFGTDEFGRDLFSRVVYASTVSLGVGFSSVFLSYIVGCTIGAIAGFYGGKVEGGIMRIIDVFMAIPPILFAIVMVTALEPSIKNLVIAISISTVPGIARMMRIQVVNAKNNDYVKAIRVLGASDLRVILVHIIPNTLSPIIVQAAMGIAGAIMAISGLSFIGLGIQPPAPEWGAMLGSGRNYIRDYWHLTLFPGLAIMITVIAITLVGDGLRDALDPKMKR